MIPITCSCVAKTMYSYDKNQAWSILPNAHATDGIAQENPKLHSQQSSYGNYYELESENVVPWQDDFW